MYCKNALIQRLQAFLTFLCMQILEGNGLVVPEVCQRTYLGIQYMQRKQDFNGHSILIPGDDVAHTH